MSRSIPPTNDQMKIIDAKRKAEKDAKRKAVIDAKRKAVPMDESLSTVMRVHKVLKRTPEGDKAEDEKEKLKERDQEFMERNDVMMDKAQ